MQFLPSGLAVPPLAYLAVLAVLVVAAAAGLFLLEPPVDRGHVLAFAPWMFAGGALHALYQEGLVPDPLEPFFGAPAVYVTTFVVTAVVWIAASLRAAMRNRPESAVRVVGVGGGLVLLSLIGLAYARALGTAETTATLVWLPVGLLGAAVLTVPCYYLATLRWTDAVDDVGVAGPVIVFAHALDGFSTALGIDVIGTGERSPIPARIMEFAADLPTEPYLGEGWLFVVVKLVVALGMVVLLADYVDEEPAEGTLVLVLVAAVGLGPAANNLFLFLLAGG